MDTIKDIPFNREETINLLKNVYGVSIEGKRDVVRQTNIPKGFAVIKCYAKTKQ